jgi:Domain of unknown function (DUF3854)
LSSSFGLTERDYASLAASYISHEIADESGIYRVDHWLGASTVGAHPGPGENYAGLIIPFWHPLTGLERERLLRRDEPDREPQGDGTWKEEKKYVWPRDRTNMFYIPRGITPDMLADLTLPVIVVEGEKKALAMWRIAREFGTDGRPLFIVIGLRGVWGWRSKSTGKETGLAGERESVKGPLNDFDFFQWKARNVTVLFDSNIHSPKDKTRRQVRTARKALADHLHYILEAETFFAEMTPEHFARGINGPDDLAGADGPQTVKRLLDEAALAFPLRNRAQTRRTPEQRKAAANELRERTGSAAARAADVLGSTAARNLAQLWAAASLSAESRDLLYTLEAEAMGCDEVEFYQADFYPLLFKTVETDFENTLTGSRVLKSHPSKKLRERFNRLEAEQAGLGITFAYYTPGRSSDEGNHTPCRVHLFSRQFVAEAVIMAEEDPAYSRGKKAARARAFARLIEEKSGVSHLKHPPKRRDPNKKIADGLKRTIGNLEATLERMRRRGDSQAMMAAQLIEILPDWLIAEIKARALREAGLGSQTMNKDHGLTTAPAVVPSEIPPLVVAEESAKSSHPKNAASGEVSTNGSARFSETCRTVPTARVDGPADLEVFDI